jgi:alkanesulfonate monooxygenase SsuD/methylene tetrahydromethanopterin reductase-like flavin-dependent oxidoreductase (luciferase family)
MMSCVSLRAEKIGYHSIVVADHVLIPPSFDESTYPAGTFQPKVHWYDPFIALAVIAGCTKLSGGPD